MKNIQKLYAAYKTGYLGNNVFSTYFSFFANIILHAKISTIEDSDIAKRFKERYQIELPLFFVRQVLSIGVQEGCFIEDHGKYSVVIDQLKRFRFDESDFDVHWDNLKIAFRNYCLEIDVEIQERDIEQFILDMLDDSDESIIVGENIEKEAGIPSGQYAWYTFVQNQAEQDTDIYKFIAAVSVSNIAREALFYTGESILSFNGLNIYLDSPVIFALLGMDEDARINACKKLIYDIKSAGCSVHVLDHNFHEVDGILARAAGWATSPDYDIRKANNAARYFHDSEMTSAEITEFCGEIEDKLNEYGITVVKTNYDALQDKFQEDENALFQMIKDRYMKRGYELSAEKEQSVRVDVRSIIMVYRKRRGQTTTRLENAKHLMLTSNNAIANVSKRYESKVSINSGHVPACVSVDLFGAVLWLNSPIKMIEYQKQKLLADCYDFLKPDKKLIEKYIASLEDARKADEIDEKKFLFLRAHPVVMDSLMNITRGDYARFNSDTYKEVYEDIEQRARKQYKDEADAHEETKSHYKAEAAAHGQTKIAYQREQIEHEKTKDMLRKVQEEKEDEDKTVEKLSERVQWFEKKVRQDTDRKIKKWEKILTGLLVGLPYLVLLVVVEIIKSIYVQVTQVSDITWINVVLIAGAIIISTVLATLFKKIQIFLSRKIRAHFERKNDL